MTCVYKDYDMKIKMLATEVFIISWVITYNCYLVRETKI